MQAKRTTQDEEQILITVKKSKNETKTVLALVRAELETISYTLGIL